MVQRADGGARWSSMPAWRTRHDITRRPSGGGAVTSRSVSTDPPRTIVGPALAIAAALLSARVWFIAHRALDLDEFEHVHAAWSVARGLLPYRDFFEPHPPALYFSLAPLFAAAGIDSNPDAAFAALVGARVVMWVLTIASVVVVYRLGTLVRGRTSGV